MSALADATEAYQAFLEGARAHPDDEDIAEDLEKARAAMEVEWLKHTLSAAPPRKRRPPAKRSHRDRLLTRTRRLQRLLKRA